MWADRAPSGRLARFLFRVRLVLACLEWRFMGENRTLIRLPVYLSFCRESIS